MSTFAVTYRYVNDPDALDQIRPEHRAFLGELADSGRLLVSGPYVGDPAGALLIFSAGSAGDVRAIVDGDPFVTAALVEEIRVQEWNAVIGPLAEQF